MPLLPPGLPTGRSPTARWVPVVVLAGCFAEVEVGDATGDTDETFPIIEVDCTDACADTSTDAGMAVCYSCQCKSAMDGWLPEPGEIQCAEGEEIVIYTSEEDGSLTPVDADVSTCANPTLLYGTCSPGGRLVQVTHGTVTAKVICRRNHYVAGAAEDEDLPYDDVGIILHNSRNGASCWYDDMDGTGIAGRNMPDIDLMDADEDNLDTYLGYYYFTEGSGCVGCHDNDPYNYTPFLQSVHWQTGDYVSAGFSRVTVSGMLEANGSSHLVSPDAAACTSCHRITSTSTCSSWGPDALGVHKGAGYEQRVLDAASNPDDPLWYLATWMPYDESADPITDRDTWEQVYGRARDTVSACCEQPGVDTDGSDGGPVCQWEAMPEG